MAAFSRRVTRAGGGADSGSRKNGGKASTSSSLLKTTGGATRAIVLLTLVIGLVLSFVTERLLLEDDDAQHRSDGAYVGETRRGEDAQQRLAQQQQAEQQRGLGSSQQKPSTPSKLLPAALSLLRRGVPLESAIAYPNRNFTTSTSSFEYTEGCSCLNPKAKYGTCCKRHYRVSYLMNIPQSSSFIEKQRKLARVIDNYSPDSHSLLGIPTADYRDVLVLRNMYDAVVEGYVAHIGSKPCNSFGGLWRTMVKKARLNSDNTKNNGKQNKKSSNPVADAWKPGYELDPPANGRTLCQYVADEPAEIGLRAYIDWAFRVQYLNSLTYFAMSRGLPEVQERTTVVCREDLESERRNVTLMQAQHFLYNGTKHRDYDGDPSSGSSYVATSIRARHARENVDSEDSEDSEEDEPKEETKAAPSMSPERRDEFMRVIRRLDDEYYGGDIAWLQSVIPCK